MKKIIVYLIGLTNIAIIFFFWYQGSILTIHQPADVWTAFGRLFGLSAVFCVLLQFVIRGRAPYIEGAFGLEKISKLHRLNGYVIIIFIILHPLFMTIGYMGLTHLDMLAQFVSFLIDFEDVFQGFIGTILFIVVVFTSIYIVRKHLKYEFWYWVHLMTYLAIFFAFGHQLEEGGDFLSNPLFRYYWYFLYAFVFGNVLIFRFGKQLYEYVFHRFYVSRIVSESPDVNSIYIGGVDMAKFHINPGQFMIFRFLDRTRWYEAHPFSLSKVFDGKEIRVTAKNVGDFTSVIKDIKPNTPVLVDGPYGAFTLPKDNKKLLFVAGGIGVTPIRSMIEQAVGEKRDIQFIYSASHVVDLVFLHEFEELQKIHPFSMSCVISQEKDHPFELGRIDAEKLARLVPDLHERDIYICGGPQMMTGVIDLLKSKGVRSDRIHFEEFAL